MFKERINTKPKLFSSFFLEILKILLSLLITHLITWLSDPTTDSTNTLKTFSFNALSFIIIYIVSSYIITHAIWIFRGFFGRLYCYIKPDYLIPAFNETKECVFLGVELTDKYLSCFYVNSNGEIELKNDKFEIALSYFLQAYLQFDYADKILFNFFPDNGNKNFIKASIEKKLLSYIGKSEIATATDLAYCSITKIINTIPFVTPVIKKDNEFDLINSYSKLFKGLQENFKNHSDILISLVTK